MPFEPTSKSAPIAVAEIGNRADAISELRNPVLGTPPLGSRLSRPKGALGAGIFWPYAIAIVGFHLLLPLLFVPWLFSWTGVLLVPLGNYLFGSLGINLGYHRLLTHGSLACPKWLEHTFALLGVCCLQDAPARWVVIHRMHHQHSDEQPDPHSPWVSFLWGHVGWLLTVNRDSNNLGAYEKYARDILQDRFYLRLERRHLSIWVYTLHAALFFVARAVAGWLMSGTVEGAVQFGASVFVWGVIARTVYVWHITWAVNSAAHRWGYRNYATDENSYNNWLVAILTNGEGWHNNHHADQRSAAHGHRWWELDLTYLSIVLLKHVGLAWDVLVPNRRRLERTAESDISLTR